MVGAPPPAPPPPPPPGDGSSPSLPPGWGQSWPGSPPLGQAHGGRDRVLAVLAVFVGVSLVGLLLVGALVVLRNQGKAVGVPSLSPLVSLPPVSTPPPASAVHPLPSALPAGSPAAGGIVAAIPWRPFDDGTVRVTPNGLAVDVALVRPGLREWVPVPLSIGFLALRIDARVTVTEDTAGNRVGLACRTADQRYGATFSIDGSGEWFMSLDWPQGPTLFDNAQSAQIHPPGTVNLLSVVCADRNGSFEMAYAINGTVVADEMTPLLTSEPLHPELYLCSCQGSESMSDADVAVSMLPGGAAATPAGV
jgi:hypothetical protein